MGNSTCSGRGKGGLRGQPKGQGGIPMYDPRKRDTSMKKKVTGKDPKKFIVRLRRGKGSKTLQHYPKTLPEHYSQRKESEPPSK